jgi:hypothetical protein
MEVNYDEKMTPIDFEVTGSMAKVTGALTKKKVCLPNNFRFL